MIALLVVALSVSMAAAGPEYVVVSPGDQQLTPGQSTPDGTYATYNIAVTWIPSDGTNSNTHTMYADTVYIVSGAGNLNDLMFRFHHAGEPSSGWLTTAQTYQWHDDQTAAVDEFTSDSLTVDVLDTGTAENCKYRFKVHDSLPYPGSGGGTDSACGTSYGTSIPEFTTLAIPVVALLGLVLFMRRKKD